MIPNVNTNPPPALPAVSHAGTPPNVGVVAAMPAAHPLAPELQQAIQRLRDTNLLRDAANVLRLIWVVQDEARAIDFVVRTIHNNNPHVPALLGKATLFYDRYCQALARIQPPPANLPERSLIFYASCSAARLIFTEFGCYCPIHYCAQTVDCATLSILFDRPEATIRGSVDQVLRATYRTSNLAQIAAIRAELKKGRLGKQ